VKAGKFVSMVAIAIMIMIVTACGLKGPKAPAASPVGHVSPPVTSTPAPPATSLLPATTSPTDPVATAPAITAAPAPVTSAPPAAGLTPAGSCHARDTGLYVLPDPTCTPGAIDPAVTPATIDQTVCREGWTSTIRPPENYTENLKRQQMAAYGDTAPISSYEEDHLIPLELGGSPTSPQNLWPEPGASPNPKDAVEDAARSAVCDGRITLAAAQQSIARNWIAFGQQLGITPTSPAAASTPPGSESTPTPSCTVTASYNSQYNDYDVYVHSNQPDQTVTVTTNGAPSASWHTDSTGYADVYLKASRYAAGQSVSATVGGVSCSGTLG
jgi:hypothetical protein